MSSSEVRAQGRLHVTGYQFAAPRIMRATAHRHYTWCNRGPGRSPYVVAEAKTNMVKETPARMFTRPKWLVPWTVFLSSALPRPSARVSTELP